MDKKVKLLKIANEISKCKLCKKDKFGLPVPGEGDANAKIMFIGEAPGIEESKTGKPFVGRAGKFLDKLLRLAGIDRKKVFITSLLKYYPGKRAVKNWEIEHGKIHLWEQIETIKPKLIVLLGDIAKKAILEEPRKVSLIHGKLIKKGEIFFFPTFHPAAAMRFPKIRKLTEADFIKLKNVIRNVC